MAERSLAKYPRSVKHYFIRLLNDYLGTAASSCHETRVEGPDLFLIA